MSITYDRKTPHRFDVVGSYLRPEYLKEARKNYKAGKISEEELHKVEDQAITDLIHKQKEAGLGVLTDGEFRRETWHLDFMWAFEGVGHQPTTTGLPFADEDAMIDDTYLTGKLGYKHHPFVDHFKFVQSFEDDKTVAKQTIPAPAQFLEQFEMPFALENTLKYYDNLDDFHEDVIKVYRAFINELYAAGCRNLQLDDCSWGLLVDPRGPQFFNTDQAGLDKIKQEFLDINNAVIDNQPSDLTITTHVCRGNFHSTYAASGGYDDVASFLFEKENVDAYFLEFDDARSGGFEPLKYVSGDKKVVLGLVTTKSPLLEKKEDIIARIHEASKYVPLDRLYLSPQCGFASCEIGNKLTEHEQWKKIQLVKLVAQEVWG